MSNYKLILLHGFAGQASDWHFLFDKLPENICPITVDLLGHGKSSSPEDFNLYSADKLAEYINAIFEKLNFDKAIILGYSMGGRVAASFHNKFPNKVLSLIFESSTFGIENEHLRMDRINSDTVLVEKLLNSSINEFVIDWYNQPLFKSLKQLEADKYNQMINEKYLNNPIGLSGILKGFGTGQMPNFWSNVPNISVPGLFISGRLDEKYSKIGERISKLNSNFEHICVEETGHNIHLEKPKEFINLINSFLIKYFN